MARRQRITALAGAIASLALGVSASTNAASAAPDTIFGSATPTTVNSGDAHSVELGVKFQSEVAGSVTGIRFYKAATNTGTHIGSLWSASGTLLASATFTSETASGWQQVNFSTPVSIAANTTYVAAYFAPKGDYSANSSAFATAGVSNPPLSALANSASPNGVYTYSATSVFPTNSYKATNYWVDVDFEPLASSAPGQVTNVTATAADASATVKWTAPSTGGSPISSYTITPYIGTEAQPTTTITGSPPATSATITGLTNGTSYTFTVTATNAVGSGPASEHSTAVTPATTTPSAPTGVTASAGNASATVTWTAPSNGGSTITSYTITPYIGTEAQASTATITGSPPATSATITGLTNGTSYTFTVTAANANGSGPASEHSTVVTPTSSGTQDTIFGSATPATIDSGDTHAVELGVKFQSEVAGSVTGIRFYKAATNTGTHIGSLWSASGTLLASATFTSETASGWQRVNFATPVAIAAGTTYVAGYFAPAGHYSANPSAFATAGVSNPPLSALANSASPNGVYTYSATSVFPTNSYKATNYWVDVEFEPVVATAPGQVTNVSATAGLDSATVTWSAPSTGGAVTTYTITPYIGTEAQAATKLTGSPPLTSATITGLSSGTSYTFTVQASNTAGSGPVSTPSNAVTPAAPTAPAAPTEVKATAGAGTATVTWTAPENGGSPITKYTVTPFVGSSAQAATTVTGSPPATSATITGLTNGTAYTFTVTATNSVGTGPESAASSAVTPATEPIAYPDLQVLMPTGDISIVHSGSTRTLEFTHITSDLGAGPWEVRPVYNPATGISQGYQALYTMPSPGVWKYAYSVPFAGPMIWTPPSDYNFPIDKFWLYNTAPGGGPGSVVATSPKVLFCMTSDTFVGGVPNAPSETAYPASACESPEGTLGLSVGWGDQYEATDGGEGIEISSLANGTYWLVAEVDPYHYFQQSNYSNDLTDTKLEIEGDTVKVLEQTHPNSTPPTVALTSPTTESTISGTTTLTAAASGPNPISSVQFLLDGEPIGSPVTAPPYTFNWVPGSTAPGKYFLSAQATDSTGLIATAPDVPVTVSGKVGSVTIGSDVSQTGTTTITTPAFSTSEPGEVLLAFADTDGPSSGGQTLSVSGAGLDWSLVKRANAEAGDAEIWTATTVGSLLNATVTATAADSGYRGSLTVVALSGAAGIGASATASAAKGAPSIGLTATEAGSVAFATGADAEKGTARTLGTGQELLSQTIETSAGDTFWTQYATAPSSTAGQTTTLDDTAPTADSWNIAGVEVLPSPPEQAGEAPKVSIINPTAGEIVSNTTQVTANVSDNVAISSVQFYLDGRALGAPVTKSPYAISWDTSEASNASHTLTAIATNSSGGIGESAPVSVTVQNPAEEEACFIMDVTVNATGKGAVTTQGFTNAEAGEQMYAFVSSDGPAGAGKQSATVSGAGLTWTLVKRANSQSGDAEIWTAEAKNQLSNVTVTSTPTVAGYDQSLTVISMQGSNGSGASVAGGAASGEASVSLTTQQAGSLVYAVGTDWDNAIARTLGPNQTLMRQDLDTTSGNTFWSQFTSAVTGPAGSVVTMNDPEPTSDDWNMAAVEIVSDVN